MRVHCREHRLDREADAGFGDLGARALAEAMLVGGHQLDAQKLHRGAVLTPPETAVGKEHCPCLPGGEAQGALALFAGLGPDQVITSRNSPGVTDQDQAHPPEVLALGGAIAVGGIAGEVAALRAARVFCAADQGPVDQADATLGHEPGEHHLDRRHLRC
jgi:hypothetical protein